MAVRGKSVQSSGNLQYKYPEKSVFGALSCNEEVHVLRVKGNVVRKATRGRFIQSLPGQWNDFGFYSYMRWEATRVF